MTALARRLWPCLLALVLAGAPARALAEDKAHDPLAARAEMALWLGDIEGLEALYNEARRSKAENPWNGRPAVQSVRSGIAAVLG
ncbi:MAG: hypothetical protein CFE32_16550, partial [Alphaproteobacteria bacterium PA3]